ncbi:SDR family NAD(P)-dependent oxidoreductase [Ferruginibacter paludis]|uniref:type I polyketide synthase n=1 Tax=Ferruginibacter paludis TaxID=1310417 RepID=UPI0025B4349A|nr:type I polyketide synthase [Ferruginibacter paludis]MDN3658658.1 SDR family NAD(P)-dependent oxidoreductase [Ferruginibacter paludis]
MNTGEIQDWIITHLAELLHIAPATIDIHEPFANYGLSSLDAVTLSGDLEELLGNRLSPTLVYEYPSISLLSIYLGEHTGNQPAGLDSNSIPDTSREPIAIIGIGCRFPGAKDPESFWQLLSTGTDAISEVPGDRWPKHAFYHPDPAVPGKAVSYWGGFLDNIDQFDPFFFGISPMEAEYMDPQQRLLLELSYEALDDAGQIQANIAGTKTGVFIGISISEYSQLQFDDPLMITSHSGTGSALSIAANRISYFFDFHGPSIAIDTACSSSLAAVHMACQSLRSGECGMALAGGVNMILSPAHSIAFTKAGVLAPDGRCKAFDARANGYVRGEGGGVIVLKPLSSALADKDPIYALIPGSAISQDGRTNGLMAPNREAQEAMLREAYHTAGISPASVQYVETHGTGTLLGDSMEAKALGAVIGANRTDGPCAIGSVKTNIGHLEAAAGIAGLIKVILSIQHRMISPSLHYQTPNPHIPFNELHLRVQNELTSWPPGSGPAIAGVSSFGFGGTIVHVVVREADHIRQDEADKEQLQSIASNGHLLPLSANSFEALQRLAGNFLKMLADDGAILINDLCYAAGLRRSEYDYRLAAIGHSRKELCASLESFLRGEQAPFLFHGSMVPNRQPRLVFVFPGQGGQWCGMGRELLQQEPVFYKTIERIDQAMQAYCTWSLMNELRSEQSESRLDEIDVVQPMLFAIQVALAGLWQSWGIKPDAVVGHSMGEVAAAHVAGILNLEDATRIICRRSQLLKQMRGLGSMLVTELSPDQAKECIKGYNNDVVIAVINSPGSTVLSGDNEVIKEIMDSLQRQNLFCKLVNADVASHSPQMDHLRTDLLQALNGLHSQAARIPFYSTVTGAPGDHLNFNAEYWMDNLREPVLFSAAIGQLFSSGHSTFIEIGPHPILLGAIEQSIQSRYPNVRLYPSLRREEREREVLLKTLAALYTEGYSIAWNNLFPTGGKYVHLPPIAWQRQRYWIDGKSNTPKTPTHRSQVDGRNAHPLLGDRMNLANSPSTFVWQSELNIKLLWYLQDHRIGNEILFPAAGYIEMALQAAEETGLLYSHELCDFVFKERMILQNEKPRLIQALLSPVQEGNFLFSIYSRPGMEANWMLHASATFIQHQAAGRLVEPKGTPPDVIRQQSAAQFTSEAFYLKLQEHGLQYGPGFRQVEYAWCKDNESLGRIQLPGLLQNEASGYQVHPVLLDACLQVLVATPNDTVDHGLYLPASCKRIRFFARPDPLIWSHVSLQSEPSAGTDHIYADIQLLNENNQIVAELSGFQLQRTSIRKRPLLSRQETWLYQLGWQVQKEPATLSAPLREGRHWLILADDEGLGAALAKNIEAGGDSCHLLFLNEAIKNLNTADDVSLLEIIEQHLREIPSTFYGIVHLWSLSIHQPSPEVSDILNTMQMQGCNSVLLLVQALAKRLAAWPRLWLVTRGTQSVKSGEPIAVEQAPVWGLGKVISFEYPELSCVRIDLDPHQSNGEAVPLLFKQISIEDHEDQIAYRAGVQFVLRLLPFTTATSSYTPEVPLRADGTYLVTGGLGGLGLITTKWLAQQGARHLVLVGRSEPSAEANRIVEQLREEGIEVVIAQADVSDSDQFEPVFKNIEQNMPLLRGVIHAAGVLDDGSLLNLDTVRMKNVMAPKVNGTWNLHKATLNAPLDFFVLFSSVVSVLGSPGQGNYAAASAYLDAMAYYRRSIGLPAISINWGPWAEVGLAAEATERLKEQNASTQHLIKVIHIDKGLEILGQMFTEPTPQVVVLPFDLKNLLELYPTAAGMPFFAKVGGSNTRIARHYARPNLRQQYAAPRNDMERKLAELWRRTLHIDRIGIHDSFFELGGDSVLAAQILALAQKTFGIRINPQDAFKAFTIERLAEKLAAEMLSKIEEMSEEEAQRLLSKKK